MTNSQQSPSAVTRVHYGAHWTVGPSWRNFDASPTLWLERLPIIGAAVNINARRFPREVEFGDIVKGLPVPKGSAVSVYASHVLEHLSHDEFWLALRNTFEMLAPGGTFRLIVPDLESRAARYVAAAQQGDPNAAARFLRETYLGREQQARSVPQFVRALFGKANHLWMWDEGSMAAALRSVGFVDVRRCELGDAEDDAFKELEAGNRFVDPDTGDREVAFEAKRPVTS